MINLPKRYSKSFNAFEGCLRAIELTMVKSQRPVPRVVNINDLMTLAKRPLPKAVFDYLDGGAEQEATLRENCAVFKQVTFRPKQAVSYGHCELSTQVLDADLAFPAMLAPIGYSRLMHPGGEVAAARAAEKAGIGYILSTISGHKIENVKAAAVTWEDFKWIRNLWQGPLVVKGILTGEDARHAVDEGATAIVVSNHGGRQLDGVSPTLAVLREVIAAVDRQVEVLIDGGIRRGSDIVKAICMGAKAVLIGRAYAYGLAAAGESGVVRALEILRDDVERTLRLLGCRATRELDMSFVKFPCEWQATN